jgi:hypothetical protein
MLHVCSVYGVKVMESKANGLWIYGVGHVYRVYRVKIMEGEVNGLWI